MKILFFLCFVFCFNISCVAQSGYCYAQCYIPQKYQTNEYKYFVRKKEIIDTSLHVKKTIVPFNPDYSIAFITHDLGKSEGVWDTLFVSKKELELDVVEDTLHHTHQLSLVKIRESIPIAGKDKSKWHEVICEIKITKNFIEKLQLALINKGYYMGELQSELSKPLKSALINYQKDHNLPIGCMDLQTLKRLGVID